MQKTSNDLIIFLIVVTALILAMLAFIISIVYLYRKRQIQFVKSLEQEKLKHEKSILNTKLEIQEQTFLHISREIHDNINLSLTLAKLNLNTIDWDCNEKATVKVESSIGLLSQCILQLSDISKSLNADIIIQQGLLKAIEEEVGRISGAAPFHFSYNISGNPVYMDTQKELIIFRIIQEAISNIIKHAQAQRAGLKLHYNNTNLGIIISDNGIGFHKKMNSVSGAAGLRNMEARTQMLNGQMNVVSQIGKGTTLNFIIPIENNEREK